jgi:polyisoprenoid-binding protein YceI
MRPFLLAATACAMALPAAAAPPTWVVQRPASTIGFTGSMNGQAFNGSFGQWNAQIAFDPKDLAGSHIAVTIDTASARTGDETRDEALPTPDWFNAKAFARATFVSRTITAAGPGRYVAQGDLTIRNVTRPVSLPFTLAITGDTAKAAGSLAIDRSAFGVGQGQWKTGEAVGLKVQVNVSVTAGRGK